MCVCLVTITYAFSFVPCSQRSLDLTTDRKQNVLGRIIVHDRIKMEASVLSRFFSHNSFPSLRRQLSYFSFYRLGKGRQRESTYVNEGVIEIDDILSLKRRSGGSVPAPSSKTIENGAVLVAGGVPKLDTPSTSTGGEEQAAPTKVSASSEESSDDSVIEPARVIS